jgi:dihydrofolate reductase
MISLILARADNGVIGANGGLPWRLAEDMRRFKALTLGKPVVMGRKTWDSLPKKPLPGRSNIVVTRQTGFRADGASIAHSFEQARELAGAAPEIMIIGGADIFAAALPQAGRVYLTSIHAEPDGDVRFPGFSPSEWMETAKETGHTAAGLSFSFAVLEKVAGK